METLARRIDVPFSINKDLLGSAEQQIKQRVKTLLDRGHGGYSLYKPFTHDWEGFPEVQPATEAGAVVTAALQDFLKNEELTLTFEDLGSPSGRYKRHDKIILHKILRGDWVAATLAHEASHHILGHDLLSLYHVDLKKAKAEQEVPAESAAWITLSYFGIENPRLSSEYIAEYLAVGNGERRIDEFDEVWEQYTLATRQASETLIGSILTINPYAKTLAEKAVTTSLPQINGISVLKDGEFTPTS